MKALFAISILLIVTSYPTFAQVFETPGLREILVIETDGYEFDVDIVSNFDITNFEFNKDEKRLTLFINSGVKNNISELQIPKNLINGNFTFILNEEEITSKVQGNENISFITVEFPGNGTHKLDIIGTTYLPEFSDVAPLVLATSIFGILIIKRKSLKELFIN